MPETKRVRPRPNMIHVEMSDKVRGMLNECVAFHREETDEFYSVAEFVRDLIREAHETIQTLKKKSSRNSKIRA